MSKFYNKLERFLSVRADATQTQYLAVFVEWSAFCNPEKAKESHAWRFITEQKKRKGITSRIDGNSAISWRTIERKVTILRAIYKACHSSNPFASIQLPRASRQPDKRPTQALPISEVKRLCALPGTVTKEHTRDSAILAVLFGAGLRISELQQLCIGDYRKTQYNTKYLLLRTTKANRHAEQPLPVWAAQILEKHFFQRCADGAKQHDPMWPNFVSDDEIPVGKLSLRTIQRIFKKWVKRAKIEGFYSCHSARATAITALLASGADYRSVQEFSRHSSVQMVEVYDKRTFGIEKNPGKNLDYGT